MRSNFEVELSELSGATVSAVSPPAVHHSVQSSRNPLDDPDLARYLTARSRPLPADPDVPTSQELNDQLLHITPSVAQVPGPPRPNALAGHAALWAEMREGVL